MTNTLPGASERILDIFKSVILLSGIVTISPTEEADSLVALGQAKEFITTTLLSCAGEEISYTAELHQQQMDKLAVAGLKVALYALNLKATLDDAGIAVDEEGNGVNSPEDFDDTPF